MSMAYLNVKTLIQRIFLTLSLILASAHASALILDFNDTALSSDGSFAGCSQISTYKWCHGDVTYNGFELSGAKYFIGNHYSANDANNLAYNGTDYMLVRSGYTVAQEGGGAFSLDGLDITNWYDNPTSGYYSDDRSWQITGNLLGGGTISQTLTLDNTANRFDLDGNDLETFVLTGFDNLTSFSINQTGGDHPWAVVDNFVINAVVPEPGTLVLLLLGVTAIVLTRRRSQKVS